MTLLEAISPTARQILMAAQMKKTGGYDELHCVGTGGDGDRAFAAAGRQDVVRGEAGGGAGGYRAGVVRAVLGDLEKCGGAEGRGGAQRKNL